MAFSYRLYLAVLAVAGVLTSSAQAKPDVVVANDAAEVEQKCENLIQSQPEGTDTYNFVVVPGLNDEPDTFFNCDNHDNGEPAEQGISRGVPCERGESAPTPASDVTYQCRNGRWDLIKCSEELCESIPGYLN